MPPISYARHRFPPAVIQQAIWLYLRFTLSYRDVEELLAALSVPANMCASFVAHPSFVLLLRDGARQKFRNLIFSGHTIRPHLGWA
jgi:hypothetical protein